MKTIAQKGLAVVLASAAIAPAITATQSVDAVEANETTPESLSTQTQERPINRSDTYRDPDQGPWYERNTEYRASQRATKDFSGYDDDIYPSRYDGAWYEQDKEYRATKELPIHRDDTYRDPDQEPWYERNTEYRPGSATKELPKHRDDTYRDPHEGPWYERNTE
ncbi:MAG: hypothetical protein F6K03_06755 [Kamptonema sp. SIO4C4]|nr:hypothetical protein [Kamptonema sp. SIO4C4]